MVALLPQQGRLLESVTACGGQRLGAVKYECPREHYERTVHATCKERACPACGGGQCFRFVRRFEQFGLVTCPAFHFVVTLPSGLRPLWDANRKLVSDLMFEVAAATILGLLGTLTPAVMAVLHTAGQGTLLHPHLHFVITAGGLDGDDVWRRIDEKHLFSVKAFRRAFRGAFISALTRAYKDGRLWLPPGMRAGELFEQLDALMRQKWNVYIDVPRGAPMPLIKYLARSLYGGAVRDHQIVAFDGEHVTFHTERSVRRAQRRIARGERIPEQTMPLAQFAPALLVHWLPRHFKSVRYYGLYAPRERARLELARHALEGGEGSADDVTLGETACVCPTCRTPLTRRRVPPATPITKRQYRLPTRAVSVRGPPTTALHT